MIIYCSKCGINWARLHSQESDGDEQYEFCPACRSAAFLEEGNDITAYIMNPLTGEIVDADTGLPMATQEKPRIRVRLQPANPEPETLYKSDKREDTQDAAIDAYLRTGSAAEYFKTFQQHKN